jgi:hypothetical protein
MLEIQLIFIVNGEDVSVTTSLLAPMSAVRAAALLKSHNTGRTLSEWEIRDERGAYLDPKRTVNSYGFEPNTRFFLTLKVGLGGALAVRKHHLKTSPCF